MSCPFSPPTHVPLSAFLSATAPKAIHAWVGKMTNGCVLHTLTHSNILTHDRFCACDDDDDDDDYYLHSFSIDRSSQLVVGQRPVFSESRFQCTYLHAILNTAAAACQWMGLGIGPVLVCVTMGASSYSKMRQGWSLFPSVTLMISIKKSWCSTLIFSLKKIHIWSWHRSDLALILLSNNSNSSLEQKVKNQILTYFDTLHFIHNVYVL